MSADLERLRILEGDQCIADQVRSLGKGEQIDQEAHINALWLEKPHTKLHRVQDRLSHASARVQTMLQLSAERGHVIKTTVRLLNQLLDDNARGMNCLPRGSG